MDKRGLEEVEKQWGKVTEKLKEGKKFLFIAIVFLLLANFVIVLAITTSSWKEYEILAVTNTTNPQTYFSQNTQFNLFGSAKQCTFVSVFSTPPVGCVELSWDRGDYPNYYEGANFTVAFLLSASILSGILLFFAIIESLNRVNNIADKKMTNMIIIVLSFLITFLIFGALLYFPMITGNDLQAPPNLPNFPDAIVTADSYYGWSYWILIPSVIFILISFTVTLVNFFDLKFPSKTRSDSP